MPARRRSLVIVAAVLVACGPPPAANDAVTPDDAVLYIKTNLADADLYVDGRLVGRIGFFTRRGVAVMAGTHRLELRHDDYFSTYLEVVLKRAERKQVDMELWAILP